MSTDLESNSTKPRLLESGRGFAVYWGERNLHPGSDAIDFEIFKLSQRKILADEIVVFISPLLWYASNYLNSNFPCIGIELEPALYELSKQNLPTNAVLFGIQENSDIVQQLIDYIAPSFRKIRKIIFISCNGGRSLHSAKYQFIEEKTNYALLEYWRNRSTMLYHGRRWIINLLANLQKITNNQSKLLDITLINRKWTKVLVCAAGPSLNSLPMKIAGKRQDYLIICADTALSSLLAFGIYPDIVIVLEGQWHNLPDFYGLKNHQIPLVWSDITAHASTLHFLLSKGATIEFFQSQIGPYNLHSVLQANGLLLLPALGSVGVVALWFALQIAIQHQASITLIGLDFKSDIAQSHAIESPSHKQGFFSWRRINPHHWLKGNWSKSNDTVLSSYAHLAGQLLSSPSLKPNQVIDWRDGKGQKILSSNIGTYSFTYPLNQENNPKGIIQYLGLLKNEIQLLINLVQGPISDIDSILFLKLLHRLDFFFLDFPDTVWPPTEPEALCRIHYRLLELKKWTVLLIFIPCPQN